jgi:hypothetical protein
VGVAVPPGRDTGANTIDCARFAAADASLDLVSKLCVFALGYRSNLPDFIAQQTTTSLGASSTVTITAQVTYRQGVEQHSLLTINGKPFDPKKPVKVYLPLITNGEFGPILINLFEVPNTVEFTFQETDTLLGVPVAVFDFHLPKDKNTFWAIRDPKRESLKPEFRGHLWLDATTGYIAREEVEPAVNSYQTGITSMKLTTDYAMTKVIGLGSFLLPVKSESIVCVNHLGTNVGCVTNTSVFHDYQKFTATTRILPAE